MKIHIKVHTIDTLVRTYFISNLVRFTDIFRILSCFSGMLYDKIKTVGKHNLKRNIYSHEFI